MIAGSTCPSGPTVTDGNTSNFVTDAVEEEYARREDHKSVGARRSTRPPFEPGGIGPTRAESRPYPLVRGRVRTVPGVAGIDPAAQTPSIRPGDRVRPGHPTCGGQCLRVDGHASNRVGHPPSPGRPGRLRAGCAGHLRHHVDLFVRSEQHDLGAPVHPAAGGCAPIPPPRGGGHGCSLVYLGAWKRAVSSLALSRP